MGFKGLILAVSILGFAQVDVRDERPRPPAGDLARALQQRYERIRDFSADFVHTYQGGVLRRKAAEQGKVLIKKPGRMRWEYETPEKKVFVSDGTTLYSYVPRDRQVIVAPLPSDEQATTPTLFLTGRGDLVRDFTVAYGDLDSPHDGWVLELRPKRPEPEYEALVLAVDQDLRLQVLRTLDAQGGTSTIRFSNLKENVGLTDKMFNFQIPRGADVISERRPL